MFVFIYAGFTLHKPRCGLLLIREYNNLSALTVSCAVMLFLLAVQQLVQLYSVLAMFGKNVHQLTRSNAL